MGCCTWKCHCVFTAESPPVLVGVYAMYWPISDPTDGGRIVGGVHSACQPDLNPERPFQDWPLDWIPAAPAGKEP